jgi:polysaccharide biosynthesis transport protein
MNDLVKTENRLIGLNTNLRSLEQAYQTYRNRLSFIPELEQTQRILERKLGVSQTTYEGLLKRLQEVQITENQTIGTARILSPATKPTIPVSPKIAISLLQGGALGLALAIVTLIILQSTDTMIRTTDRAKEIYGYLLLAILPNVSKKIHANPAVYVRDNPRAPIGEAYRMLQGGLRFLRSDKKLKVIVVTSAVASEGKSTISSNLAITMAQLGRKVLLVDADMRRPSQHTAWQLTNDRGLSNVLVGESTVEQAIRPAIPNLSLITAGVIPPDPVAIIDSQDMTDLIQTWSKSFDYVIIDTPPILAVIDALLIAKLVDGLLLVSRPGVLNVKSASRARAILNQAGINVLGMVTNDASGDDSNYYMYNYYYTSSETPSLPAAEEGASGGLNFLQRSQQPENKN